MHRPVSHGNHAIDDSEETNDDDIDDIDVFTDDIDDT